MTKKSDKLPPAPTHLSARSRKLWADVGATRARSPGRLALMEQALAALDRADQARSIVDKEGLTTTTKSTGAVHVHPMLKAEREFRAQFMSAWQSMGLGFDHRLDGAISP